MRPFFLFFLIFSLILLAACGEEPECTKTSDCPGAGASNACSSVRCVQQECRTDIKPDCCGNNLCEDNENFCNCDKDCATTPCEGAYKVADRYGRPQDAKMLEYGCVKDSCELIIADAKKEELTLTSESRSGKVKLAATTTIEQPYVLKKSKASVRIQLKDVDTSVIFPIKVTQIQLLTGDQLIGEVLINEELQSVRDLFTKTIQLKPTLSEPEQQLSTTIKIDFEYQYIQREETLTERETFSDGFKNQLFFIDYSKVEDE